MDEMNFDLDDTLLSPTEDLGGETIEDSTGTLGASHNPFSSGFDAEHPLPSYDELRNAGFSDYLARHIWQEQLQCILQCVHRLACILLFSLILLLLIYNKKILSFQ